MANEIILTIPARLDDLFQHAQRLDRLSSRAHDKRIYAQRTFVDASPLSFSFALLPRLSTLEQEDIIAIRLSRKGISMLLM